MFSLFGPTAMCYFRHCEILFGIKVTTKTVAFVEITCQSFCSYAVAFLFSKTTKFDFPLSLLRPTQKDIFLVIHFSVKNWNYSTKATGRNAKQLILWLGANNISEVQRSLPSPRYEKFSGLRGGLTVV